MPAENCCTAVCDCCRLELPDAIGAVAALGLTAALSNINVIVGCQSFRLVIENLEQKPFSMS
jgi:hypothetical protein